MLAFLQELLAWFSFEGSDIPRLLPLMVFLCILFLIQGLFLFFGGSEKKREKRIKERLRFEGELEKRAEMASLLKTDALPQASWKDRLFQKISQLFKLEELLLQAAIPWQAKEVAMVCIIIGLGTGTYGGLRFGPSGCLLGFVIGAILFPYSFLVLKKRLRLKKFEKQLPEALGLMARSLKAGHSFPVAMQLVAEEMPNPIGIEFFKTFKEYSYGLDFKEVMQNLYRRNQLKDLKFFITAILIQRETGGNLVEILEKISSLIRERFKLVNHIKALTAEGRLSGLILMGMPIGIGFIIYRLNPGYISLLWTHPLGYKMLVTAIFFQIVGMLVIQKIVNVKV